MVLEQAHQQEVIVVPEVWHMEVLNVLMKAERRKRIQTDSIDAFLTLLDTFRIETDEFTIRHERSRLIVLSRTHQLSIYDTFYLELAMRRNLPLATLDQSLQQAAISNSLPSFP